MRLLAAMLSTFALVYGAALLADSALPMPAAQPWSVVELEGRIDAPGEFQLFGEGEKEFELRVRQGIYINYERLAFASHADYANVERHSGMFVRVTGVRVDRGGEKSLVVKSVELLR